MCRCWDIVPAPAKYTHCWAIIFLFVQREKCEKEIDRESEREHDLNSQALIPKQKRTPGHFKAKLSSATMIHHLSLHLEHEKWQLFLVNAPSSSSLIACCKTLRSQNTLNTMCDELWGWESVPCAVYSTQEKVQLNKFVIMELFKSRDEETEVVNLSTM